MAEQRVGDRSRLLGDLLEHEVLVAALFGGRDVPVDVEFPRIRRIVVAVEVGDAVSIGGDDDRLVLTQLDGIAGVFDERGDIRADEHLALADTEHQRGGAPGGDDRARVVGVGEDQGEVALQPAKHGQHGGGKVPCGLAVAVLTGDQVDGDLGVGVTGELDACGFQFGAHGGVVLDDAVVDDHDLPGGVAVRMGIAIGRPAVGRPAGVPETRAAHQRACIRFGQRGLQVGQPSGTAAHRQPAVAVEQGDT